MLRRASWIGLLVLGCSGGGVPPSTSERGPATVPSLTPQARLEAARQLLQKSDYAAASQAFRGLFAEPCCGLEARLGEAEVLLTTGRNEEALALLETEREERAEALRARALLALGRLDDARESLEAATAGGELTARTRPLAVLLGEVLILQGRRAEAEARLMPIIEQYNEDVIQDDDGPSVFAVALAAELLRSPEDANHAFNLAEQALGHDLALLLARARLFLDNHDPGHAEEVTQEILEVAPNQPDALVNLARVRLDQAMDFGEATRLCTRALAINPKHSGAHFTLAGIALRDMRLEKALAHTADGLAANPNDLELLSMRAAAEFLGDDPAALERTKTRVFELNPQYSRFYSVIAEYAEWEHRYEEVVKMMLEAVRIDPEDAKAHAQLGINRIRSGEEAAGVDSSSRAFALDPFNVRVHNTLNLYREIIPRDYVSEHRGKFNFRFSKLEQPVLSREVPPLIDAAWQKMVESYAFEPETPVGIELYYDRQHFAVRTSGLPQIAIQGVCFGKTLASMSPRNEQFNLGMTLWHELAHVFHIQLSRSHVPRWFTEGLAEYETLDARPEWKRERDAELFRAFRERRLPKIGAMNEAFTHAENLEDVTVAYYASTQIVTMLVEDFGRSKLREMLVAWGKGLSSEQVIQSVLGVGSAELDTRFERFLERRLARFSGQYLPPRVSDSPQRLASAAKRRPRDAEVQARLAGGALERGDLKTAKRAVDRALALAPKHPDALWFKGQLALARKDDAGALAAARELVAAGHDGYEVQSLIARSVDASKDPKAFEAALVRAHEFDPDRPDPIFALLRSAAEQKDTSRELEWLLKIAPIVEHDGAVHRRLAELLLESGELDAALGAAKAAVYADMEHPESYQVLGRVEERRGRHADAERAFESATLCPAEAPALARAHEAFAEFLERRGQRGRAEKERARARSVAQ